MLELCTGSRLHFGLLELAVGQPHRFGGLGLMISSPQVRVRITQRPDNSLARTDCEVDLRIKSALEQAERMLGRSFPREWSIEVPQHPLLHSGLGCGTQLAAATTAAIELAMNGRSHTTTSQGVSPTSSDSSTWQAVVPGFSGGDTRQIRRLAILSGRGKRSAIGLHGFLYGGLVQDLGYDAPAIPIRRATAPALPALPALSALSAPDAIDEPRPIATRSISFPESWPIVLILGTHGSDVQGVAEESLIQAAAAAANSRLPTMLALSQTCLSAVAERNFGGFVEAIEAYMQIAASLFATVQAGRYRDAEIARRVNLAERAGLRGVGQSSWGPTVFAFASERAQAEHAAELLRSQLSQQSVEVIVTSAVNHGAQWRSTLSGDQHAG